MLRHEQWRLYILCAVASGTETCIIDGTLQCLMTQLMTQVAQVTPCHHIGYTETMPHVHPGVIAGMSIYNC